MNKYGQTRKTSPSATMRGLPAAPPRRSLRSPHTPSPLASLARAPLLLALLAHNPHASSARPQPPYLERALQNGLNWPRYIQTITTSGNNLADNNEFGNFRPTSGHTITLRANVRSLPVKFRYLSTSQSYLRPLPVYNLG